MSRDARPATAILGAGRLARAIAAPLQRAGYPIVAVYARRRAAARAVAEGLDRAAVTTRPAEAVSEARLILLAVSDDAIATLARTLAAERGIDWKRRIVLHHAGSLGRDALAPLAGRGAATGVLHPLQCLGRPELAAALLPGSRARVEGDRRALTAARRLAADLEMVPIRVKDSAAARQAYHAAAALASNDLVALFGLALRQLETTGLPATQARAALLALVRGTIDHLDHGGVEAAATGPAARGDVATLRGHLDRIARDSPEAAEVHRLLSIEIARTRGRRGVVSALRRPAGRPRRGTV